METEFKKVDLHIHTPMSDDYRGDKEDDEEYLRILRKAKLKHLSIIAITDHNSVEGYRKIRDLERSLAKEKARLLATKSSQSTTRLTSIEKDLSLFKNILILPGVELELRDCIHILVIFNNSTPVDVIYRFISDAGYKPSDFGKVSPSTLQHWDIFSLYDESKKYDCLVIDAHTDSTKGIWDTLRRSMARANALKSPQLVALCYRSETQKHNIQNLIDNTPEYKRDTSLSFIKCSDAHETSTIGSIMTWIRLDKVSFQDLKEVFHRPSEKIFTEEPSSTKILDELLASETSYGLPDMSEPNMLHFCKLACALNNTNGGHLLLGVSSDKKKVGLAVPKERHRDLVDNIILSVERLEPRPSGEITVYPLQADRIIISLLVSPSPSLAMLKEDGRFYSIENRKLTTLSAHEVQRLIETRVTDDIGGRLTKRLRFLERECQATQYLVSSIPIIRNFEDNSYKARLAPTVDWGIALDPRKVTQLRQIGNGLSRGNLFFSDHTEEAPRLEDTYLRYTVPIFVVPHLKATSRTIDTIYIVRGGAVYYSPKDLPTSTQKPPILKLNQSRRTAPYGISFTVCFLKSSFLIWYCKTKFETCNIFLPEVLNNLRFPIIDTKKANCLDLLQNLKLHFDKILKLEKEYLLNYRNLLTDDEKFADYTNTHNALVDGLAYDIDLTIYQLLRLTPEEIRTIEGYLTLNHIYLPTTRPSCRANCQD